MFSVKLFSKLSNFQKSQLIQIERFNTLEFSASSLAWCRFCDVDFGNVQGRKAGGNRFGGGDERRGGGGRGRGEGEGVRRRGGDRGREEGEGVRRRGGDRGRGEGGVRRGGGNRGGKKRGGGCNNLQLNLLAWLMYPPLQAHDGPLGPTEQIPPPPQGPRGCVALQNASQSLSLRWFSKKHSAGRAELNKQLVDNSIQFGWPLIRVIGPVK